MSKQAIAGALAAVGALAAAVTVAGCGETKSAASLVPANAAVYAEVDIDPQGDQEQNIDAIARKFPDVGDPERRIAQLFDEAAKGEQSKLRWNQDVKPWLGESASLYVSAPRGGGEPVAAGLIAAKDEGKAQDTLEQSAKENKDAKRSFEGTDYWFDDAEDSAYGLLDGQVVVGNEAGFKAVVTASKEENLEGADRFSGAWDKLPDDRIAAFYVDNRRVFDAAAAGNPQANTEQLKKLAAQGPAATTLWARAERDGLLAESEAPARGLFQFLGRGTPVLETLPQDSWFALGLPKLGETASQLIDSFAGTGGRQVVAQQVRQATGLDLDRDLISWMGDLGAYVRGTRQADLGGGAVIISSDPAASERALTGLARAARRQGEGQVEISESRPTGADVGYEITAPNLPEPIIAAQAGDRVVFAYGEEAAEQGLAGRPALSDNPDFGRAKAALGGEFKPSTFISVGPILDLASALGAGTNPNYAEAEKFLRPFSYLVAGTRQEGDTVIQRLKIALR
jgi:hypothetical protein